MFYQGGGTSRRRRRALRQPEPSPGSSSRPALRRGGVDQPSVLTLPRGENDSLGPRPCCRRANFSPLLSVPQRRGGPNLSSHVVKVLGPREQREKAKAWECRVVNLGPALNPKRQYFGRGAGLCATWVGNFVCWPRIALCQTIQDKDSQHNDTPPPPPLYGGVALLVYSHARVETP